MIVVTLPLVSLLLLAGGWVDLFNARNLDGWESIGDGLWTVMRDGTLVGQRDPRSAKHQAWLYTKQEYAEFDLRLEYWARQFGNSGISIRDTSRAKWAVPPDWDAQRTPSHIGYEVQISSGYRDSYPTGSIYLFAKAKAGVQVDNDWNLLEIESRREGMRVRLNGQLVAEHAGEPGRPLAGPIGLQLHDRNSVMMFRRIRIRLK